MTNERRGLAECASSAAAFGSVGVLVALAQREHVGTTTLLASRYALGALALWVALLSMRRPLPSLRIGLIAVALGATTYAAASATYLASIERMGAGPAGVVSYCYPVLVMAGAIMLGRERLSRRRTAALGLAVAGVGLLVAGGGLGAVNLPGALLAFASACVYTAYVLTSSALRDRIDALTLSTLVATGAAGAFAIAHAVHGGAPVHTPRPRSRSSRSRSCRPPSPSRPSSPASVASARRARASPPRSSPRSRSPAACCCSASSSSPMQFLGAGLVVAAVLAIELRQFPRLRVRLFPKLVPRLPRPDERELVQAGIVRHARDEAVAAALALEHARPELAGRPR